MKLDGKALPLEIKDKYAKKDLWSIEEFIALILKQNPEYFSLTELKRHPKVKDLYDLVIRGIKAGKLRIIRNVYGSQLDSDEILKPLDGQVFAKEKDLPLDMEEEIRKYHVSDGEDLETKYQKLEAKYKESEIEKNKLLEKVKELEEKPAHGSSLTTCYRIIFLLLREAYGTSNYKITEEDFKRWTEEFKTSIELLRDDADIKLPFPEIPHEKTINSTIQNIIDKFYKNNKNPKIKPVK
jgi:hypothetical protein